MHILGNNGLLLPQKTGELSGQRGLRAQGGGSGWGERERERGRERQGDRGRKGDRGTETGVFEWTQTEQCCLLPLPTPVLLSPSLPSLTFFSLPPSLSLLPQGIWRIPVDEIDRPGSFASHMNRSIVLLLVVLSKLRDHDTLLKVSFMLQRTPDQGK